MLAKPERLAKGKALQMSCRSHEGTTGTLRLES